MGLAKVLNTFLRPIGRATIFKHTLMSGDDVVQVEFFPAKNTKRLCTDHSFHCLAIVRSMARDTVFPIVPKTLCKKLEKLEEEILLYGFAMLLEALGNCC